MMVPPTQNLNLDITAISGILGAISIACWIVVFSPQIIENFRKSSADALSLQFVIIWLAGDIFNILGAVLQGVLPTMLILAVYYTLADIVLLGQCFYYRGFTWKDAPVTNNRSDRNIGEPTENTGLLPPGATSERRSSAWSDDFAAHLSPAVPLHDTSSPIDTKAQKPRTRLQAFLFNTTAILLVCIAGIFGWYISNRSQSQLHHRHHRHEKHTSHSEITVNLWGQIFGYLCAILYLGSRIPQMLLNYRRKSTEGVSMLFFLFACVGNLTYVLSIFAYEPRCQGTHGHCKDGEAIKIYRRYVLVNASWIAGSAGTLILDMIIFGQFFIYRENEQGKDMNGVESGNGHGYGSREGDQRPLLDRGDSEFGRS